jgi:hypothetical protein
MIWKYKKNNKILNFFKILDQKKKSKSALMFVSDQVVFEHPMHVHERQMLP